MANVAFLGLGVMGFPMAGWLARKGHAVTVYNRTAAKAERWCTQYEGRAAATPAAATQGAEIVFSCVGDDPDLREIALGAGGAIAAMKSGAIYVDHTTASADLAREIAAAGKKRGIACLDAPVSGGQAGAENGKLTVMVGGEAAPFATAEPVIRSFAQAVRLIGPAGSGQLTKMVNQIAIAGAVQGLAEALNFGQKAGLDMEKVIGVISKGAAQSWQMDNRWKTMVESKFEGFGFASEWLRKDLNIALAEAKKNGASLPNTALIEQSLGRICTQGHGRWDNTAIMGLLND